MASYGGGDTDQEETTVNQNPITQVGLNGYGKVTNVTPSVKASPKKEMERC